ncbi:ThiF family adenylyltransferase [Ascidiimonas sp. W6]|uniref:ThiF family adenylyltransferase n=1 Tax=Ascidiimonas meishanensis TaxID=3128903 RepID=UPI0030EC25C5
MYRYIRQTQLKGFGVEKQLLLKKASVLVIGAGGLGVPVLQYLCGMGIGTLGIVENDTVSLTNLQRQVIYTEKEAINKSAKLKVALKKLKALNSEISFKTYHTFLNHINALSILSGFDIIVDCSDNFETRYLINDACVILKKPFVYGALHAFEGHLSVFNYKSGPTYRCLFPNIPTAEEIPDCNTNGVLGVIPGIIGNFQALEVVKLITEIGTSLSGKLMIYDGLEQQIRKINIPVNLENFKIQKLTKSSNYLICSATNKVIDTKELKSLMGSVPSLQLVDVRNTDEYKNYAIPGSIHIPLDQITARFQEINSNQSVYLICESGVRSAKALKILSNLNPELEIFEVDGGIRKFKEEQIMYL